MDTTLTLKERDELIQKIITLLMCKHGISYKRATNVFTGMVAVVLEEKQLEMLLKVALKEND